MRFTPAALVALLVSAFAFPAPATGQDPAAPPSVTPAPAAPPPAPTQPAAPPASAASATGKLALQAERVGRGHAVLTGARWRVRGTLTPFVAGQQVTVRFVLGRSKLKVKRVSVRPSKTGRSGTFLVSFASRRAGRVSVTATHAATAQLSTVRARPTAVDVLPARARPGSKGLAVRVLQERLARLGYVVGRRGSFDARTARAVVAFRKVTGMARTATADRAVFARLARGQGAFRVKYPRHGRHIEADISRQVVALIGAGGKVERIFPTSSGAPGTPTILGSFKIYRKDFGTNAIGMVHAAYFIRGYAIHGYSSVPTYNASHGCLRVPVPDALGIFRWVRYGTRVDTYR